MKSKTKTKPVLAFLKKSQKIKFKILCARQGESMSDVIRSLVERYILEN